MFSSAQVMAMMGMTMEKKRQVAANEVARAAANPVEEEIQRRDRDRDRAGDQASPRATRC